MAGPLMQGKRALVTGVANDRSIAWAIAQLFKEEGAELVFTYPGEAMEKRVRPLAESIGARACLDCDVAKDADIERTVADVKKVWDRVDVLVHSIGFAPRNALDGRFTDATTREVWAITMDVSAYSLIGLARAFKPMMPPGSSIVSLTYYGAEKVVRNYNVMGVAKAALEAATRYLAMELGQKNIRVNAISGGPLRTMSALAVGGFSEILGWMEKKAPLRRNVTGKEVGDSAAFLLSEHGSGITGQTLYVDCGYSSIGL